MDVVRRPPLEGDTDADIVIVGAGYTGLWTAYYLRKLDPTRNVLVVEAGHAGWGASGRNGGWCSAELPVGIGTLASKYGRSQALAMRQAGREAVNEIGRVIAEEDIECGWRKDGTIWLARNEPQRARLMAKLAEEREYDIGEGPTPVDPADLAVPGLLAAAHTPHCAALHPAKLAVGLAGAAVRHGVRIVEETRALEVRPGMVLTDRGQITARVVVQATEAYSGLLPGQIRRVLPLTSRVIATEPIPDALWRHIGWPGRATMSDQSLMFPYLQRTSDNRLVIGGRSIGYRYGAVPRTNHRDDERAWEVLEREIPTMFPALADIPISHRWSGVLGVHRDWQPRVTYDLATGLASAGGYVGDGVALSNLAGRTLAALITGTDSPANRLCWVGPPGRRWEPEPLPYLAIQAITALTALVDTRESRTGGSTGLAARLMGIAGK
ncbi:NAD(P)/FAD-dependent oxidoreductase [Sinosporangium siamense]|uniref:NAD(P)/FAD-dependent oxidoreductase n=1 Tax=Sinosporangium siamense TaxID=1367973 RepID=UPI0019512E9C|nr:FAD-dependent oxidoreductase [Sinosporangium siamense]